MALDWLSGKLYLVESIFKRIDIVDTTNTLMLTPLIYADPHSGIRGIAVDPFTRYYSHSS